MSYAAERAGRHQQLLWSAGFFAGVGSIGLSDKGSLRLEFKLTTRHASLTRFMLPLDDISHHEASRKDALGRTVKVVRFTGRHMQQAMARLEPYLDSDRADEWRQLQHEWQQPFTVRNAARAGLRKGLR